MKKLELLAPAKNYSCAIAALKAGADAVYIGSSKFGARSAAGNDLSSIKAIILFAHQYYAKVYVTINTILNDNELSEVESLIQKLYLIGTDAIIIQDMAILEMNLPPIPIFASTQMNNDSVEKIQFLENIGIQRIILPREMSMEDIKDISSKVKVDLEAFVHGALCVCYSGQCYMSYSIGKRSANRGECAQPCRKKYSLMDSNNNIIAKNLYLLSLKDLNLSDHLDELIKAGISSFKIEGRLKDEHYVTNVVSFYRHKLDQISKKYSYKRSSSGYSIINYKPDLNKTFNRGYTPYFATNKQDNVASIFSPKSMGEYLGKVKTISKEFFILENSVNIAAGDGICFYNIDKKLCGSGINKVISDKIFPNCIDSIKVGTEIFRNEDVQFNKSLESINNKRLIEVKLFISDDHNNIKLDIIDEDNNCASSTVPYSNEKVKDRETFLKTLKIQLEKLGNTIFYASNTEINLQYFHFITIKQINKLRREAIQQLLIERDNNREIIKAAISKNNLQYPVKDLYYDSNINNSLADSFFKRHGSIIHEFSAESGTSLQGKRLMKTKYCLKKQLGFCSKKDPKDKHKNQLYLLDQHNQKYQLKFNCTDCYMEIFKNI